MMTLREQKLRQKTKISKNCQVSSFLGWRAATDAAERILSWKLFLWETKIVKEWFEGRKMRRNN